jgi:hypothetical protein
LLKRSRYHRAAIIEFRRENALNTAKTRLDRGTQAEGLYGGGSGEEGP